MRKLSKTAWLCIVLALALTGTVAALIYQTRIVEMNITVEGLWDFNIYEDSSCTEAWTTCDKSMARESEDRIDRYIKNISDDPIYIKWNSSEPNGITISMKFKATGNDWIENNYRPELNPDESITVEVCISIGSSADAGTHTFDLSFYGADSSTG